MLQPGADTARAPIGIGLTCFAAFCVLSYTVLIFVWIGLSWAMIPPEGRRTRRGKEIPPAHAVAFLFLPFFNLYWVFVQSIGLCDALDRQLIAFRAIERAPRALALVASVVQVVPYANLAFGPLLWLPYIFLVDAAKAEYVRVDRRTNGEPGLA